MKCKHCDGRGFLTVAGCDHITCWVCQERKNTKRRRKYRENKKKKNNK